MLDRIVEQARGNILREDTPTEQRVEAAFLYHAGLSYWCVEVVVGRTAEAVRRWYHRLAHLFGPAPDHHATIVINERRSPSKSPRSISGRRSMWTPSNMSTSKPLSADLTSMRCCSSSKAYSDVAANQYSSSIPVPGTTGFR